MKLPLGGVVVKANRESLVKSSSTADRVATILRERILSNERRGVCGFGSRHRF